MGWGEWLADKAMKAADKAGGYIDRGMDKATEYAFPAIRLAGRGARHVSGHIAKDFVQSHPGTTALAAASLPVAALIGYSAHKIVKHIKDKKNQAKKK